MDFSPLDHLFDLPKTEQEKVLFQWGQDNLRSLQSKELERACADLSNYFVQHPQKEKCPNLIVPPEYWGRDPKMGSHLLSFNFKEFLMNTLVYGECSFASYDEKGNIVLISPDKAERFIYRDYDNKKDNMARKIKISGFTLLQKDIVWNGIVTGYLDVPAPPQYSIDNKANKPKKIKASPDHLSEEPVLDKVSQDNPQDNLDTSDTTVEDRKEINLSADRDLTEEAPVLKPKNKKVTRIQITKDDIDPEAPHIGIIKTWEKTVKANKKNKVSTDNIDNSQSIKNNDSSSTVDSAQVKPKKTTKKLK